MSYKHNRRSSCPTLEPLSENEAHRRVQNLGVPYGIGTLEDPLYEDHIPDNISDISETNSYRSIDISTDEKMRQELVGVQPNGDDNLKFHRLSYDGYHSNHPPRNSIPPISTEEKLRRDLLNGSLEVQKFQKQNYNGYQGNNIDSNSFSIELLSKRKVDFPKLGSNCRKKIISCILFFLLLVIVIVVPLATVSKMSPDNMITISDHTMEYQKYWLRDGNLNNLFFNNQTFGTLIFRDPCLVTNNLDVIRNIINADVSCDGRWCQSGKFSCSSEFPDCYDISYLISPVGPEFPGTCKNITGNLIMMWKRWQNELLLLPTYQNIITEVTEIIGLDNINYARGIIDSCGTRC